VSAPHDPVGSAGPSGGDHPGDLLSGLLDGELGPEAVAAVEAHVAGCTACRHHLADVAGVRAALRDAPRLVAPPMFAHDLVRARHRASRRGVAVALAAASVVVVAGLALAPGNPDTSAERPSLALMSDAARAQSDLTPRTTTSAAAEDGERVPVVQDPADDDADTRDRDAGSESFADRVGDAVGALLDAIGG
jgi:anti-sigma factor RsiW